uniref:Putative secreted protein n=1 Tax=Panstrongylus lignarius TaxID=156445 RepID=A0A224XVW7_9HEMI
MECCFYWFKNVAGTKTVTILFWLLRITLSLPTRFALNPTYDECLNFLPLSLSQSLPLKLPVLVTFNDLSSSPCKTSEIPRPCKFSG